MSSLLYRFENGWVLLLSRNLHLLFIQILVNFYNTFSLETDVVQNLLKKFMSSLVSASLLELILSRKRFFSFLKETSLEQNN